MPDSRYLDPEIETMPRRDIEAYQEERILELVPYVYERSALVRATWDAAKVHPRDIRSLADFRRRVPLIAKEDLRSFRAAHDDPYAGLLCVPPAAVRTVWSTSGTTGEPTFLPDRWMPAGTPVWIGTARDMWEFGLRRGDHALATGFTSRGPWYQQFQLCGAIPLLFDSQLGDWRELLDVVRRYRAAFVVINLPAILAWDHLKDEIDMKDALSSFRCVAYAGEPLGPRMRRQLEEWGVRVVFMSAAADVGGSWSCLEDDGLHLWEDIGLYECLDPESGEPVADGQVGELVATALDNPVAPLVRYRSDDLVRMTREPCACGRTHARQWPLGRRSDEVVVDGRSVLPVDLWGAIEDVPETGDGVFQIIRPRREMDRLHVRVGYDPARVRSLADLRARVATAVHDAVGLDPVLDLVPEQELLAQGPVHKIPRVTAR